MLPNKQILSLLFLLEDPGENTQQESVCKAKPGRSSVVSARAQAALQFHLVLLREERDGDCEEDASHTETETVRKIEEVGGKRDRKPRADGDRDCKPWKPRQTNKNESKDLERQSRILSLFARHCLDPEDTEVSKTSQAPALVELPV